MLHIQIDMSDNVLSLVSELVSYNLIIKVGNNGIDSNSNIIITGILFWPLQEIECSCFFNFIDAENL